MWSYEVQKLETPTILIDCHAKNIYQGGPLATDTSASQLENKEMNTTGKWLLVLLAMVAAITAATLIAYALGMWIGGHHL